MDYKEYSEVILKYFLEKKWDKIHDQKRVYKLISFGDNLTSLGRQMVADLNSGVSNH